MTTQYALLLPGNEDSWDSAPPEHRDEVYGRHREFMRLLDERGHTVVGGAELAHSKAAKVVRGALDDVTVTDGPYAETVEQLTGFYLVRTDDPDDLMRLCGLLAGPGGAVEVRECVTEATS